MSNAAEMKTALPLYVGGTGASAAPPKLRRDLVISCQTEGDSAAFVVKDPASGRFFRFRAVEGFILEHLDGTRPLEAVRSRTEAEFSSALPAATLEQFVRRLRTLGLLETDAAGMPAGLSGGRVRGNLFHLRWRLWDPDWFFTQLVERIGFFFTPRFVMLSSALIIVAGFVTAANWLEVQLDFPRLYNTPSLLLAYVTMLVVIALHECAHGLTCKFFGGSVREIGFLLLLFQPAFYCNVSDAWLFPQKARRLWVTFAGAYFEIFVWALATLVWRVTEPWTAVNFLALVVMATSGIKTLFNLNPLIKLDGYYLLSDWLGIPNLRQRAFAHLRDRVGRLWGMSALPQATATERERRIFWIYGLLAWGYTFWLLGFVLWYLGGWLIGRFQGWGFILLTVLLAGIFQYPLRKLLRAPAEALSLKSGMKRWIKWALRLAVLGTVAAVLWFCHTDLRIAGPFTILPVHNADVRAKVEGILHEIYADEGDVVKQGDAIASMGDRDYLAELRKTKAEIEEKQARLNLLKAGTRPEEIQLARTIAAKTEERTKYARVQLETERVLFEQSLSSRKDYDEKRELVAVREKEQQEANDHIKLLLAGSRKEEIEATEAEVRRLQAHQRYIEEQLQLLKIVSPVGGVITTRRLKDKLGQSFKKGDLIAKVHELQTVTVEIAVPESDIADVVLGQKIVLKTRAHPHLDFEGSVTAIAPVVTEPDDPRSRRTVLVTTQLDNRSGLLKPEMTGHAKIYCGEKRLINVITRRLLRFIKVEFWSWW
jgi:putative peptide zinc metalloprotease protein